MATRQLLLELEEVEMAAEKGSKRVRESALTAQTKTQHRCDCPPERPPASPPGLAMPSAGIV